MGRQVGVQTRGSHQNKQTNKHFRQDIYKMRDYLGLALFLTGAYERSGLKSSPQWLLLRFPLKASEWRKGILNETSGNRRQNRGLERGHRKRLRESRRFRKLKQRLMLHGSTNSTFPEMEWVRGQTLLASFPLKIICFSEPSNTGPPFQMTLCSYPLQPALLPCRHGWRSRAPCNQRVIAKAARWRCTD